MEKTCPYSMGGEITECVKDECTAWTDGECGVFERGPLSLFFIAKNLRKIEEELNRIRSGR